MIFTICDIPIAKKHALKLLDTCIKIGWWAIDNSTQHNLQQNIKDLQYLLKLKKKIDVD